jgi:mRNA-degrading endonuclease toxin of MazEF toxin-antitoxin module
VHDALDDFTVAYVLAARPHFENLRHVAAQLAGLLVLAATGARSAAPDHLLLHSAETLFQESIAGIRQTRTTDRALTHHRHLTQAAAAIERALTAARVRLGRPNGRADLDPILTPLRAGYTHLQHAANALPGFEMVAFDQGCCGSRVQPTQRARRALRIP